VARIKAEFADVVSGDWGLKAQSSKEWMVVRKADG
jgi:hypothetical protein